MYYVSDIIRHDGEKLNSAVFWPFKPVPLFTVEVTDLDSGEAKVVKSQERGGLVSIGHYEYAGVDDKLAIYPPREAVVKHTRKSAMLHRYVLEMRTIPGVDIADSGDIDTYVYDKTLSDYSTGGKSIIGVNTSLSILVAFGGIMFRRDGYYAERDAMTLYDVLCDYCKSCNVNMMAYERVVFYTRQHNLTTEVRFSQSAEAKRFFAKMCMDVMR